MVLVVDDTNAARYGDVLDKVYRFRHALFVERLKREDWRRADGREIDRFDGPGCIHLVRMTDGAVSAYARLLPTTRPHPFAEVHQPAPKMSVPSGPRVYEWTRCGALPSPRDGVADTVATSTAEILAAAAEMARVRGIDGLLAHIHPILVNRLMACGWDVEPLGLPTRHHGEAVVAVYARLTPETATISRRFSGADRVAVSAGRAAPPSMPLPFFPAPLPGTEIRLRT